MIKIEGADADEDGEVTALPDGESEESKSSEVIDSIDDRVFVCIGKTTDG